MIKKALLITYYWPPAGGPGVHRWLRLSKYFKENKWKLTVYCPENAAWPIIDEGLLKEVPNDIELIRTSIFEPHKYIQKKAGFEGGAGIGSDKKKGLIKNLLIWVRGNLFIPDSRRFWIKPSYRFLSNYLKQHPDVTHIISTGPPHSTHLIAYKLKMRNPTLKWVADFRDPWTEIDYYEELHLGKWADKKQKRLEKIVLTTADLVVTVSDDTAVGLKQIGQRTVEVVTNGFIFPEFNNLDVELDKKFSISHFGSMPASRNPIVLWRALQELITEIPELKNHLEINLFGSVDYTIIENLKQLNLLDYYSGSKKLNHEESIIQQRKTQILLLIANNSINSKGILTGKFFEYLGAKRPIFAVGQRNSDLEKSINETQSGCFVDYDAIASAKNWLTDCFAKYQLNQLYIQPKNIDKYHSQQLAKKYINLLEMC